MFRRLVAVVLSACFLIDPVVSGENLPRSFSVPSAFMIQALQLRQPVSQHPPQNAVASNLMRQLARSETEPPEWAHSPGQRFWALFGLDDLEALSKKFAVKEQSLNDGYRVLDVELPELAPDDPLDVLRREMFPGTHAWMLLVDLTGYLVAVIPRIDHPEVIERWSPDNPAAPHYIDLSAFRFSVPSGTQADYQTWWARLGKAMEQDEQAIQRLLLDQHHAAMVSPLNAYGGGPTDRQPYVVLEWHPTKGPNEFHRIHPLYRSRIPKLDEIRRGNAVLLPVLPTLMTPRLGMDAGYHHSAFGSSDAEREGGVPFDIQPHHRLLVMGPGAGPDLVWAARRIEGPFYVTGINPVEILSAEIVSELLGHVTFRRLFDNLMSRDGKSAFPGVRFDRIEWNAPSPEFGTRGHRLSDLMDYDDHGETFETFMAALPRLLADGGQALFWYSHREELVRKLAERHGLNVLHVKTEGSHGVYVVEKPPRRLDRLTIPSARVDRLIRLVVQEAGVKAALGTTVPLGVMAFWHELYRGISVWAEGGRWRGWAPAAFVFVAGFIEEMVVRPLVYVAITIFPVGFGVKFLGWSYAWQPIGFDIAVAVVYALAAASKLSIIGHPMGVYGDDPEPRPVTWKNRLKLFGGFLALGLILIFWTRGLDRPGWDPLLTIGFLHGFSNLIGWLNGWMLAMAGIPSTTSSPQVVLSIFPGYFRFAEKWMEKHLLTGREKIWTTLMQRHAAGLREVSRISLEFRVHADTAWVFLASAVSMNPIAVLVSKGGKAVYRLMLDAKNLRRLARRSERLRSHLPRVYALYRTGDPEDRRLVVLNEWLDGEEINFTLASARTAFMRPYLYRGPRGDQELTGSEAQQVLLEVAMLYFMSLDLKTGESLTEVQLNKGAFIWRNEALSSGWRVALVSALYVGEWPGLTATTPVQRIARLAIGLLTLKVHDARALRQGNLSAMEGHVFSWKTISTAIDRVVGMTPEIVESIHSYLDEIPLRAQGLDPLGSNRAVLSAA